MKTPKPRRPSMTPEAEAYVREFLARWLMEFGTEPTSILHRTFNLWYMSIDGMPEGDDPHICWAFVREHSDDPYSRIFLSKEGLAFLAGDKHDNDT